MTGERSIRLATPADASAIAAIYAPFCTEASAVSFEITPPDATEMAQRIERVGATYPWLVAEIDGGVAGYAYASPHHERAAYRWAVNVALYVGAEHRGRGVGRALYNSLFALLRLSGIGRACAGITLPNPGSTAIHAAMGFVEVGVYHHIGYKAGAWHDVAWWELALIAPDGGAPAEPAPFPRIAGSAEARAALRSGEAWIRARPA